MKKIPFTSPSIDKKEFAAINEALRRKDIVGNGPYTKQAEALLAKKLNVRYAYLATSATHALEMAMMSLGIGSGDEVIVPSFTFVSTANAIARQGATPKFCEIETGTLNLDIDKIEPLITDKTRAIAPVHYAGLSCDMDKLLSMARRRKLYVIEDAAQAIGAKYKDRYLGTIGDVGALSFHSTKNITCGEGGAFLTNSDERAEMAEIIREKGTNRSAFLKGKIDKYTWIDVGSSYVPSDLLAALLIEQLKKMDGINKKRVKLFNYYYENLKPIEKEGLISLPKIRPFSTHNGHIFWFLTHDEDTADTLISELNREGISASFHYVPLHSSPYARERLGYDYGDFPITEKVAKTLVRLPLFADITPEESRRIVKRTIELIKGR